MNLKLSEKVALVTGSSRGIGLQIANSLHREGCFVALNGRDTTTLESAAKEFADNTSSHIADVSNPQECLRLIQEVIKNWGQLDILVCNVGSGSSAPVGTETSVDLEESFHINFFSTTNMIGAARREIIKSKGTIVCISSICGLQALGAPATYSAAKAAVNSYVKNIARPLAKDGVRINVISPGNIFFKGGVWDKKNNNSETDTQTMLKREVPMNRFGRTDEIADSVCFLASEKASFITGQNLVIDGGQLR